MEEAKDHGKRPEVAIVPMIPRDDLAGIKAEGSGKEILLQVRNSYSCRPSPGYRAFFTLVWAYKNLNCKSVISRCM